MSVAGISPGTRSALIEMSSVQTQIANVQARLASGKRVNAPTDNPTAYFRAAGLSSRAKALDALMSDITNAQGAIAAAGNGITTIKSLLNAARAVANQALQTPEETQVTVTAGNSTALGSNSPIATTAGSASRFKAGDTVTVSDGTTTATYTAAN